MSTRRQRQTSGGQKDGCSDPLLGENQPMSAECGPVSLEELGSHITNRVDVSEMGDEEFNRRMKRHAFLFMLHIAESSSTTEEYFKRLFHSKVLLVRDPTGSGMCCTTRPGL